MKKYLSVLLCVFLIILSGCAKEGKSITIGGKNFTEQYVINQVLALLLEDNGFKVNRKMGLSSPAVRNAILTGQIDLYVDYNGTAWGTYLKKKEALNDTDEMFRLVKAEDAGNGLNWLTKFNVNNTYALAVTQDTAKANNLQSISDLVGYIEANPDALFAIEQEFASREGDGIVAMSALYGIDYDRSMAKIMEVGLTFEAIEQGEVQIAEVFSTDGKLKKYNLVVLEDDKNFFPPYNLCPIVRQEVLDKYPEIEEIITPLKDVLTEKEMIEMNYRVDVGEIEPIDVAREFLIKVGLLE